MQEINCIIADDEPLARKLIASYVEQVPYLRLKGVFKNAWEVKDYLFENRVDLLLLDIEMPGLDGLTFFKTLPNPPVVIFITAHRNYAVEAFEVKAADYLMKPVPFERFLKALNYVQELRPAKLPGAITNKSIEHLFISVDRQMQKIALRDIEYLEAMGDYVKFYTDQEKPLISKITLRECLEKLDDKKFVQIHRSFVVNTNKIVAYTQDKVKVGDNWLKISRSFKNGFNPGTNS